MEAGTAWPLSDEQRMRVMALGELIRRRGAARFLHGHLVRADARDFPEPWEATRTAVHQLLYRLFWHAHLDPEIVLEDVRAPAQARQPMLTSSAIDLLEVRDERVTFQVAAIGNDDVAGLASHLVGAAFLELAPSDPFRAAPTTPTAAEASIAACYLGLGVLVANSSSYRRYGSRIAGREVVSEQRVETTGGLSIGDATLLLAVQLVVRDDVPDAPGTLLPPQAEWLERWIAVLDPHEAELRRLLGVEAMDADPALPGRPARPRVPPAAAESALAKHNAGRVSFRVPRRRHRLLAGLGLGFSAAIVCRVVLGENPLWLLLFPIGAIGGWFVGRPGFACAACRTVLGGELPVCPTCGVALPETLMTAEQQAARRAEFAEQEEAADPELIAESESAYSDEV